MSLEDFVEPARAIARIHRHGAVTPRHLLAAVVAHPDAWRGWMAPIVRYRLSIEVPEAPALGAYRDGAADIPLTSDAKTLLARRGFLFPRPAPVSVLARLARATDLDPIDYEVREAVRLCDRADHVRGLRLDHLVRVLADRAWFLEALRVSGAEPGTFIAVVDAELAKFETAPGDGRLRLSDGVRTRLGMVHQDATLEGRPPAGDHLAVAIARTNGFGAFFGLAGGELEVFRSVLLDGVVPAYAPDDVDIVFHDDDKTTAGFVVEAIEKHLSRSKPMARDGMFRVHELGSAVVATVPAREVDARLAHIRRAAAMHDFPLQISTRPHAQEV